MNTTLNPVEYGRSACAIPSPSLYFVSCCLVLGISIFCCLCDSLAGGWAISISHLSLQWAHKCGCVCNMLKV